MCCCPVFGDMLRHKKVSTSLAPWKVLNLIYLKWNSLKCCLKFCHNKILLVFRTIHGNFSELVIALKAGVYWKNVKIATLLPRFAWDFVNIFFTFNLIEKKRKERNNCFLNTKEHPSQPFLFFSSVACFLCCFKSLHIFSISHFKCNSCWVLQGLANYFICSLKNVQCLRVPPTKKKERKNENFFCVIIANWIAAVLFLCLFPPFLYF